MPKKNILDPKIVRKLYRELKSVSKVTDKLSRAGVRNPDTGRPYTRATVGRVLQDDPAEKKRRARMTARSLELMKKLEQQP